MRSAFPPKSWTYRISIHSTLIAILLLIPVFPTDAIDFDSDLALQVAEGSRGFPLGDLNGDGETDDTDLFYLALYWRNPLTQLVETSPLNNEADIAITRETILRFSDPIDPSSVDSDSIMAVFGGIILGTRLHTSPDGKTVTIFYNDPLPPSARIRVSVDGDKLKDERGVVVEADRDGAPGGVAEVDFDTLTLTTLPGTSVFGRIFATELATPKGATESVNVPLEGVRIYVDGLENVLFTETDSLGNFRLDPAPAGAFFVHVDGRTVSEALIGGVTVATSFPNGHYYPFVGKKWVSNPGRETDIGTLYLPLVIPGTLHPVSATEETVIGFAEPVLAEHPEFAGAQVIVPADSLYADDGTRGGMVGIAPVPPERMPGTLPDFMMPGILISVQTDGGTNFDVPLPLCLPNIADPYTGILPSPGEKRELFSFNHDIGDFEPVGSATVSQDGAMICTDEGMGIPAPGWHFFAPQPRKGRPRQGCGGSSKYGPKRRKPTSCPIGPQPTPRPCDTAGLEKCKDDCDGAYALALLMAYRVILNEIDQPNSKPFYPRLEEAVDILTKRLKQCLDNCRHLYCPQKHHEKSDKIGSTINDCESCISYEKGPSTDPIINELQEVLDAIDELIYPYVVDNADLDSPTLEALEALLDLADQIAGGDALQYLEDSISEFETEFLANEEQVDEVPGEDVPYPVPYSAHILRPSEILVVRGLTKPGGIYSIFVPSDGTLLSVNFYDPLTDSVGIEFPFTDPDEDIPPFTLFPVDETYGDFDGDGLVDFSESILGTRTNNPDSDNDGVPDGVEVANGANPLDGLPAITGVIATADTPGTAVDVAATNDLVVLADSSGGVSVFNVFNGMNPVIVAQVDTPGTAQRVALAGNTAVVADGGAGLAAIDLSDPPSAVITNQIPLGGLVQAVAAAGNTACAGLSNGDVVWVDIARGEEIGRVNLSSAIQDLAVQGNNLYALTGHRLHVLDRFAESLPPLTSTSSPFSSLPNVRLFVGGQFAYATHASGYNTFSLDDPETPVLVGLGDAPEFGWRQIVENGSGLGVAAVGPNSGFDTQNDVSLYDVSSPADTNVFLTRFETPGAARAVSIYNGLAYAADSDSGMQVINYIAYDNLGHPPVLNELAAPAEVEEGQTYRVTVDATDDIQVRNVEFLVDGGKVATDGNFPFEVSLTAPLLVNQPTFTLQVRASDTGGSFVLSETREIQVVTDRTPPRVRSITPRRGALAGQTAGVVARFSEPLDPATVTDSSFQLFEAGPDGLHGNGDDILATGGTLVYVEEISVASLTFSSPLPVGKYRIVIGPPIEDLAGNLIASIFTSTFQTFNFTDADGDGFPDDLEAGLDLDPSNPDTDGDGILDGDEDNDNDGLTNLQEVLILGTDPGDNDSDGNGVLDSDEDRDLDGLSNRLEFDFATDPLESDTDGDGWNDEMEIVTGSNPTDPASTPKLFFPAPSSLNLALGGNGGAVPTALHSSRPTVNIFAPGQDGVAPDTILLGDPPVTVEIENQPKIGFLRR